MIHPYELKQDRQQEILLGILPGLYKAAPYPDDIDLFDYYRSEGLNGDDTMFLANWSAQWAEGQVFLDTHSEAPRRAMTHIGNGKQQF